MLDSSFSSYKAIISWCDLNECKDLVIIKLLSFIFSGFSEANLGLLLFLLPAADSYKLETSSNFLIGLFF